MSKKGSPEQPSVCTTFFLSASSEHASTFGSSSFIPGGNAENATTRNAKAHMHRSKSTSRAVELSRRNNARKLHA